MATGNGLPSAREHADSVITRLIEAGNIKPDEDAASLAAGIPSFSRGTLPLDPNTGKPIVEKHDAEPTLPGFTEGAVAIEGDKSAQPVGDKTGVAGSGKSVEELLAEHRQRVQEGQTNGQAAPVQEAVEQPAPQAQGAAAAEAAAEAIVDAFADYDEFEFTDPDHDDLKIPIRVTKQYGEIVKRGYGRRSAYDREMSYFKNAEALKPLIADGRLNRLMPLITAALNDPQGYGEYVYQGFLRAQQGLPLIEQARQQAVVAGTVEAQVQPQDQALSL